jgi:hypothetical protein
MRRLTRLGVHAIFTDRPDRMIHVVRDVGGRAAESASGT